VSDPSVTVRYRIVSFLAVLLRAFQAALTESALASDEQNWSRQAQCSGVRVNAREGRSR
jgi:hypothetical protein